MTTPDGFIRSDAGLTCERCHTLYPWDVPDRVVRDTVDGSCFGIESNTIDGDGACLYCGDNAVGRTWVIREGLKENHLWSRVKVNTTTVLSDDSHVPYGVDLADGKTGSWSETHGCRWYARYRPETAAEASTRTEGAGEGVPQELEREGWTVTDTGECFRWAWNCCGCCALELSKLYYSHESMMSKVEKQEPRCCGYDSWQRIEARRDKSGDVDPGNCPKCGATAPRALVGRGYSCSNQACVWVGTESQRVHPDEHPVLAGHRVERERVRGTDLINYRPVDPTIVISGNPLGDPRSSRRRVSELIARTPCEDLQGRAICSRLGCEFRAGHTYSHSTEINMEDFVGHQATRSTYIRSKLAERGPKVCVEPDVAPEHWPSK